MARHKFAVGEVVDLVSNSRSENVPQGKYRIQRLFPQESGPLQYHVKHVVDGHERVVTEAQLAARQAASSRRRRGFIPCPAR